MLHKKSAQLIYFNKLLNLYMMFITRSNECFNTHIIPHTSTTAHAKVMNHLRVNRVTCQLSDMKILRKKI